MYGITPKIYTKVEHYEKSNYPVDSHSNSRVHIFLTSCDRENGPQSHTHTKNENKSYHNAKFENSYKHCLTNIKLKFFAQSRKLCLKYP